MNPSAPHPHRRRLTRAEVRRRRRSRAIRRVAGLTVILCVAVGGVSFLFTRHAVVPSASAASAISMPAQSIADSTVSSAENTAAPANTLGLTADEARAMLADPLMVLVNHTSKMPDDYTFDTKECGSATAVNKTLQTVACDAFLSMQKAAAADGVTVWMQSGYRSVKYQTSLYERKTKYYLDKGYDNATAKEKAAAVVNPPGYSEHNCGLAADLNQPISTYSHGMKQKLAIIAALLHEPKLILMDEPFVGLDPLASHQLKTQMKAFCAQGGAIFFSTHVLEVAEKLCDRVAILRKGQLVREGAMEQVRGDDTLEEIFLELEDTGEAL